MERATIGWKELKAIDGERGVATAARVRETSQVLADALTDFAFGEVFSRAELGRRERELITVGVLAAIGGAEPQLRIHLEAALNVGADADELVAIAEHLSVYAGFPRALNLLRETREMLELQGLSLPLPSYRMQFSDHETLVTDTGGNNPPVVLLHALGLDRRMWRDVIRELSANYRVIAYDLRGHGHAAGAPLAKNIFDFADDLRELLGHFGITKATVIGLSMGGSIAQCFALNHADRIERLGILASTAWGHPAFEARAQAAERDGMDAQVIPTLTRWFTPEALALNNWAVRYARDRVQRALVTDWSASWRALGQIDIEARLGDISVPTFIIAGERDPSTPPELMQKLADAIPKASFEIIAAGPHMLTLEKPREVAEAVLRKLALFV